MKNKTNPHKNNIAPFLYAFLLLALTNLTGCGAKAYFSENYVPMIAELPFRAQYPLARQTKYVYAEGNVIDNKPFFLIATNITDKSEIDKRAFQNISYIYPAITKEDLYNTKTASGQLQLHEPEFYEKYKQNVKKVERDDDDNALLDKALLGERVQTAESFRKLAISLDNSILMMNTYMTSVHSLAVIGKAMHEDDARKMINWLEKTTGCIGPSAPEGTTLHIDFIHVVQGKSFHLSSENDIIVSAMLKKADGTFVNSNRSIRMKVLSGQTSPNADLTGFVPKNMTLIPDEKVPILKTIQYNLFGYQFAVLTNSAIADIYKKNK